MSKEREHLTDCAYRKVKPKKESADFVEIEEVIKLWLNKGR
ncbi:hypothetical protein [Peribacillus sp. Bi96]|nr:hypothetical protein [Peribacillus sp. Bi96]